MDVRTMSVLAGVINVLLAVVLLVQYRFNRGYSGLGWWAAGQALVALGMVVSTLRGPSLAGHLAVIAYQALLTLGTALIYMGVVRFLGRGERGRWVLAVWAAFVAWSVFHTFVDDDATLRAMGLYVTTAVLLAATAVAFWRYRIAQVRGSARFLSVVFAVAAVTYLVLAAAEPARAVVADPLYAPSPVNAGAFLAAIASTILWTFGFVVMINERLAADLALEASNMRRVFATGPDCAIISSLDEGVIRDVNEGFTRLSGFTRDEAIGRSTADLDLWTDPSARANLVGRLAETGTVADFPMVLRRKDGSTLECSIAASLLTLDDEPSLITVTRDVTQQRRMEAQLQHEATTDQLTGLPNRRHFLSVFERELRRARRSGAPLAVAVVDIDHFKDINDAYGHAAGDAAVAGFARAFTSLIRDIDTFGRLGGDEFGLLLPDADLDRAMAAVERVRAELAEGPGLVAAGDGHLTFSAGVAQVVRDGDTIETVLARADGALYVAKARGRDAVVAAPERPEAPGAIGGTPVAGRPLG